MKNFLILLTIFLFGYSQMAHASKEPLKWGKIPQEHLDMKVYDKDSSATAVVLCDYGTLEFNLSEGKLDYLFDHHRRIKILNKSAIDEWGDISIVQYGDDELSGLKAQVILPNGEEYEVKRRDIFEEDVTDGYKVYKFSFPNLVEGAVIEYKYKIESGDILTLHPWYFQTSIPTMWSEYRLDIPEWFSYVTINRGRPIDIVEKDERNGSLMVPGYAETTLGDQTRVRRRGFDRVDAKIDLFRFVQKDVPALIEEPFITTMNDYRAFIQFRLNYVAYPREGIKQILPTWPKLASRLLESKYFGKLFNEKKEIKDILKVTDPLMKDVKDKDKALEILYKFVAENMEWNGKIRKYSEDLEKCFEQKSGSSADLNLMLLALLRHYEIESFPVLVSTRENGKAIDLYAIETQFDHVCVLAKYGEQYIAIDVDDIDRPLGFPRISSLNGTGWLVDNENLQWIQMPTPGGRMVSSGQFKMDEEGNLVGSMDYKFEGYPAIKVMSLIKDEKTYEFMYEELKEMYPDMEMSNIQFEQGEDANIKATTECIIPEAAQVVGDMIYITPTIEPDYLENPFKLEERTYPVDIPYPNTHQLIINIEVPDGYVIDELPEPVRMSMPEKGASFQFLVNKVNDVQLQLISKLSINQLQFKPEEYAGLRNFFDLVVEKQAEQLVIKKKS